MFTKNKKPDFQKMFVMPDAGTDGEMIQTNVIDIGVDDRSDFLGEPVHGGIGNREQKYRPLKMDSLPTDQTIQTLPALGIGDIICDQP